MKNGIFTGPGKLKFLGGKSNYMQGELEQMNKTCMKNNAKVREIVGNFVNGSVFGQAKVTLHDGDVIISTFVNGTPVGPKRLWKNSDKKLSM